MASGEVSAASTMSSAVPLFNVFVAMSKSQSLPGVESEAHEN